MRRLTLLTAVLALAMPAPALAFHHGGLPATASQTQVAGSPSHDNPLANDAHLAAGEHCANAHAD